MLTVPCRWIALWMEGKNRHKSTVSYQFFFSTKIITRLLWLLFSPIQHSICIKKYIYIFQDVTCFLGDPFLFLYNTITSKRAQNKANVADTGIPKRTFLWRIYEKTLLKNSDFCFPGTLYFPDQTLLLGPTLPFPPTMSAVHSVQRSRYNSSVRKLLPGKFKINIFFPKEWDCQI